MSSRKLKFIALATMIALAGMLVAQGGAPDGEIDAASKKSAVTQLAKSMKDSYVFPELGAKVHDELLKRLASGSYNTINSGQEFAHKLTEEVDAICKDAHFNVRYSKEPLPKRQASGAPSPEQFEVARKRAREINGGFERVERLNGNVGYVELRGFLDKEAAERPAAAAMSFLAGTDALIIDLRRNGGGDPATVQLLCSYFFGEKPIHLNSLYWREGDKTEEFWTLTDLPAPRYLDRPVYVLTSSRTGSAAEECSYNLQTQKRAKIVGEVTWGGANPGDVVRLNDHFSAFVPTGRAINPITKTNWEGTGVKPDVAVPAADALKTAHVLALKALLDKTSDKADQERLKAAIAQMERGG